MLGIIAELCRAHNSDDRRVRLSVGYTLVLRQN